MIDPIQRDMCEGGIDRDEYEEKIVKEEKVIETRKPSDSDQPEKTTKTKIGTKEIIKSKPFIGDFEYLNYFLAHLNPITTGYNHNHLFGGGRISNITFPKFTEKEEKMAKEFFASQPQRGVMLNSKFEGHFNNFPSGFGRPSGFGGFGRF